MSVISDFVAVSGPADTQRSVMCAGMFSSGSTWAFNVVVQLLCRAHPSSRVVPVCADDFGVEQEAVTINADWLVFKTHMPSAAMRMLSRLGRFPIILSIRDPRDAVASLMQRFSIPFDRAFEMVVACSSALIRLTDLPHILLRYEDGFTETEKSIADIAQYLGMQLPIEQEGGVFAALTPSAVRATIADLQARDAIVGVEPANAFDPETLWHPGHVGDRRIGKWKELLTAAQAARVRYASKDFCSAFGYADPSVQLPAGESVHFSTEGTGVNYLVSGFSHQEAWGIWTAGDCAVVRLKLQELVHDSLTIELLCGLAPAFRRRASNTCARILINGATILRVAADDHNPEHLLMCLRLTGSEVGGSDSIEIRLEFDNLMSPAELAQSSDSRLLGLGLVRLRISE